MKMRPTISNLYSGEVIQGTHYQDKAEITPYYGIGFNKSLNKQWDLTIESILYNVNSDKLDGLYDDLSKDYLLYTSVGFKYNIKSLSKSSRNKYARSRAPIRR
jgi:outer membrane protein W